MGGLNRNARTAFAEPIGRTRGEQDLPWGTLSVAPPHHRCPRIPDFHRVRVCVKGAVESLMCDPATSVTVRTRSVCLPRLIALRPCVVFGSLTDNLFFRTSRTVPRTDITPSLRFTADHSSPNNSRFRSPVIAARVRMSPTRCAAHASNSLKHSSRSNGIRCFRMTRGLYPDPPPRLTAKRHAKFTGEAQAKTGALLLPQQSTSRSHPRPRV